MEQDDGIRSEVGIVACIRRLPDGKIRLIFDDVESDRSDRPKAWKPTCFFTWNKYDEDKFQKGELSEKELADIGLNVVLRLGVLKKY